MLARFRVRTLFMVPAVVAGLLIASAIGEPAFASPSGGSSPGVMR
jgi:hypothetical protein